MERRSAPLSLLRRLILLLLAACFLVQLLQTVWAHRRPFSLPPAPTASLSQLLALPEGPERDTRLFLSTGLSPAAVDQLLCQGVEGRALLSDISRSFRSASPIECREFLPLHITCEDHRAEPAPMVTPRPGDILLTFSTHTMGWRHGHAGLVLSDGRVLEATKPGTRAAAYSLETWSTYADFLLLRVKNAAKSVGQAAANWAERTLSNLPYGLLCGLMGSRDQPPASTHCAYLPWYAWFSQGVDLDSTGGQVVTVRDLAESPLLEVVQVWGRDPAAMLDRMADGL